VDPPRRGEGKGGRAAAGAGGRRGRKRTRFSSRPAVFFPFLYFSIFSRWGLGSVIFLGSSDYGCVRLRLCMAGRRLGRFQNGAHRTWISVTSFHNNVCNTFSCFVQEETVSVTNLCSGSDRGLSTREESASKVVFHGGGLRVAADHGGDHHHGEDPHTQ
jgi:hypothetical protein